MISDELHIPLKRANDLILRSIHILLELRSSRLFSDIAL